MRKVVSVISDHDKGVAYSYHLFSRKDWKWGVGGISTVLISKFKKTKMRYN